MLCVYLRGSVNVSVRIGERVYLIKMLSAWVYV